ncbi:unnamed protein product [Paramecium sonneborni]|uniref:Uncharacterized protein n=1 Tax=Paramecium sonneborni TaxID=65129 RepID=A0A8S1Q4M2_9CILI|nr:unnamed protein product [Paramecium sonneborni]
MSSLGGAINYLKDLKRIIQNYGLKQFIDENAIGNINL